LNLTGASVRLSSGGRLAKTTRLSAASLLAIKRETDGAEDTQLLSFWLREPRALALDRCEVTIEAEAVALNLALDLERYEQKTPLIVPFRGPGVIDQAWMSDNGHTNSTEQFAVDLLALSDRFARGELNPRDNRDYAGWGRDIVAPGAGVVAIIQDGVPEQPRVDEIDERSFILTDGRSVGYGNHVVIDHENGEFSMLAHMQANSIPVRVGDRVEQGNIIGRLGSSGMSTEPHLHYQLQDGGTSPAHSLPFRFSNLHRPLRRGLFFVTAAGDKP
jgi:murein DD-endopeptidase MepM/ murein hydrolase activator NlpD